MGRSAECAHIPLCPPTVQRVGIDLDDAVKVNYGKFGGALSPIKGL